MDQDIRAALFDGFDNEGDFEELDDDFVSQVRGIFTKNVYIYCICIYTIYSRNISSCILISESAAITYVFNYYTYHTRTYIHNSLTHLQVINGPENDDFDFDAHIAKLIARR